MEGVKKSDYKIACPNLLGFIFSRVVSAVRKNGELGTLMR